MNFDDYAEMFLYFNTILPPAAVRLNRVTILGLTPSIGCRAIQLHGFVSIIEGVSKLIHPLFYSPFTLSIT